MPKYVLDNGDALEAQSLLRQAIAHMNEARKLIDEAQDVFYRNGAPILCLIRRKSLISKFATSVKLIISSIHGEH